jgi:hypothetical protein
MSDDLHLQYDLIMLKIPGKFTADYSAHIIPLPRIPMGGGSLGGNHPIARRSFPARVPAQRIDWLKTVKTCKPPNSAFDPGPHSCYFPTNLLFIPINLPPAVPRLLWVRSTRALGILQLCTELALSRATDISLFHRCPYGYWTRQ